MSTSPITLPSHRAEAPIWAFHTVLAWITWSFAFAFWYFETLEDRVVNRKTTERVTVFAALILAAGIVALTVIR